MLKVNENFVKLPASYLFVDINNKVNAFMKEHPEQEIIRLGIGDVTRPLPKAVVEAMCAAAKEMGEAETFRGYGPEAGYAFLREAIAKNDFQARGIDISADEIFVSDGAKSDTGNIGDIFGVENTVAVCDPIYPVYVDTNVMAGRAGDLLANGRWSNFVYLPCTAEHHFLPELPTEHADLIYLCFPNNPTGMAIDFDGLKQWVDYANREGSVILYDAAYEAYITQEGIPHSIYQIEGAKNCAIEFRSYSKTAGFTGVRCAYTVVPKELKRNGVSLNNLWARRQATKFNGVSYVTQRAAQAVYSDAGRREVRKIIGYYQRNARVIAEGLRGAGFQAWGGVNSPYIWLKTPDDLTSWAFFDQLLEKAQVVGTPGSGFGPAGEGYFRLTAFGDAARTVEAIERIASVF